MLAEVGFLNPTLLLGGLAAAVPILIHLLLRPRPRRTRFPATSLLRPALISGQRANRLRNLVLLMLRAGLLLLAALLLAGPTCAPATQEYVGSETVACALVLDDSGSMGYRADGDTTLLELSRRRAIEFVLSSAAWPQGATLALLTAGSDAPRPQWTADRSALLEALRATGREAVHAQPLGGALRSAAELLRSAEQPARRIVVFTDGAAHAWRDVTPAVLAGLENLVVRVVVPGDGRRSNIALLAATCPARLHPATAPVPLRATLAAEGLDGQCWLLVQQDGRTLRRVGPLRIPSGTTREIELELPAMQPGPHALTLQLEPPDRMNFDQQRYVTFQTAPRPPVWLVMPASTPPEADVSALIIRNLLAPEALTPEQQLVELHTLGADEVSTALAEGDPRRPPVLVVVMSRVTFPPEAVPALLRHVERGATVLLVPSTSGQNADWPDLRPLLNASPPMAEQMATLTTLRWERARSERAIAELGRCAVRRRLRLTELRDGVSVAARYSDEVPAIVTKRLGSGSLMMLTTAPDPQWGDLGIRAAGLLTWLHHLVEQAAGSPDAVTAFTLHEQTRHRFADMPDTGLARVSLQDSAAAQPAWIRLSDGVPRIPWPTEHAGIYTLSVPRSDRQATTYVVNWPAEESQLDPIALPRLRQLLGCDEVLMDTPHTDGMRRPATLLDRVRALRDLRKPLAALLLAIFLFEALLAASRSTPAAA